MHGLEYAAAGGDIPAQFGKTPTTYILAEIPHFHAIRRFYWDIGYRLSRLLKYLPTTGKLTLAMVIYPLAASEKWLVGLPRRSTVCHKRYQSSISAVC